MRTAFLLFAIILALLLPACGQAAPSAIPPAPTLIASGEAVNPTVPGASPGVPTSTEVGPTEPPATMPPPPTVAPLPTSTNPPTAGLIGPDDFGDDHNPLTGELVAEPENLQRRPLAVKISNAPASYTRPQAGLNDADLVFEHTAEGNLTRFTAIFYDTTPPAVGPIRSARLIDIELPAMYDAALGYSGSSNGVAQRLQTSDFRDRILYAYEAGYYRTGENKPYEHTLYANPEKLWEVLDEKGQNRPPQFTKSNFFSDEAPEGGSPASEVTLDYIWTRVNWRYDPETGRYLRWADDAAHADANTGEQVSAANVIVLSPFHVLDPTICEQISQDGTCAHLSVQIQLWGSGSAAVFRDGQRYDVTWHREGRSDSLTFTDADGEPFPLKVGNSWVQLVPSWLENPLSTSS